MKGNAIRPRTRADLLFLPIGIMLVLLPVLADVVEGIIRAFLSAAFAMGGLL